MNLTPFISDYERQYMAALKDIYDNGFSDGTNERTGRATKRLPGIVFRVDVGKEFPILKSKQVFAKTADREIDWIMRKQSNNIHDLKAKIWNEWADEDGSIGKAYGYQVSQPVDIYLDPIHKTPESFRHYDSQVHFVLEYLKEQPNGRWAKINLWNVSELKDMNLVPCCHGTDWNLDGGRLNCVLTQRSGDMPYGVPFNTTQYAMQLIKFAKHLGVEPGILTHVITDAHIYANQMEGVEEQLQYYEWMCVCEKQMTHDNEIGTEDPHDWSVITSCLEKLAERYAWEDKNGVVAHFKDVLTCVPKYVTPVGITSFWEMDAELCKVENYTPVKRVDFGNIAV